MGTERFPTLYYYYHPTRRFLHSSHFPIVLLTLVRYRLVCSARCHISGAPTTFTTPFPYSCAGSAPHDVRFPTRTQHLLLNLHDAHYHASPEEPNHASRLKQRTLRRIVCFPLWLVVQGLRRRGGGHKKRGYPSVG